MIEIALKNGRKHVLWNGETMDEVALREFMGPRGGMRGGIDWKKFRVNITCGNHNCGTTWIEMSCNERTWGPPSHPDTLALPKHDACPACDAFQW